MITALATQGRSLHEWLVQRPPRSVWACALVGFILAAGLTVAHVRFPPAPLIHDEFSYLLAGDTFAQGRLTNPPHPMWRHFESFHIIQQPTYSSKYPPAQGLALALGQVLTGTPIVGVWISFALMVASFTWMLHAWVGARWALWGGLFTALWGVGLQSVWGYWATSYWGGAVAALGGALVLGGVRRLADTPTAAASLATGAGVAILASSRPFEGLFFSVIPAAVVAFILVRQMRARQWRAMATTITPATLLLFATAIATGLHNRAVTGSSSRPPYVEYESQYASSPTIMGLATPQLPHYRVDVMKQFYTTGNGRSTPPRNPLGFLDMVRKRIPAITFFYIPFFVAPLLVALPWLMRDKWTRVALACLLLTAGAVTVNLYYWQPHYAAPAAAAWCILLIQAARFLTNEKSPSMKVGRVAVRFAGTCLVVSVLARGAVSFGQRDGRETDWYRARQAAEERLGARGEHLVIVKYGPHHGPDREWVYNRADIDASPVVWARSLGDREDAELRAYYAQRTHWQLYVDDDTGPFTLTPLAAVPASTSR